MRSPEQTAPTENPTMSTPTAPRTHERRPASAVRRWAVLAYGAAAYAAFLATTVVAFMFISNIGLANTIDAPPRVPLGQALVIDAALLALFAVQHSGMARKGFKTWLTRVVPQPMERSTYVLATVAVLGAMVLFWEPIGMPVWEMTDPTMVVMMHALALFGWTLVLTSTFLINHFDLFGLRQVWMYFRGEPYAPLRFRTPRLYRHVRHPLYIGWMIAFWATPTMTMAHFVFAVATTLYMLAAIQLEERDLVRMHPEYATYRRHVPMIIPRVKPARFDGHGHGTASTPVGIHEGMAMAVGTEHDG
jgi:protein-S-isoprenylcysteine O-methyltransferase Ste14